jgi:hypothetical protein
LITSILRLVTFTSGYSLTFSLQLVFQDFLSRLSFCAVVKVRAEFPQPQASFRNPENDTDD